MTATITIQSANNTFGDIIEGENTRSFIDRQTHLTPEARETVVNEASKILSQCIKPGVQDSVTNLAIGYVQSGKTLSFTTLTALAADNGYRMVIYLTGTKTNLERQTSDRLEDDLVENGNGVYKLVSNIGEEYGLRDDIQNWLRRTDNVILIPILKHYKHINDLVEILSVPTCQVLVRNVGVIIIDDEADQASLNTYAYSNSQKTEWEEDEISRTYASICALKQALPSHSYVQYTATPQAPLLINSEDVLSPQGFTVLTPGEGYTGGQLFFGSNSKYDLLHIIPEEQVYNSRTNQLTQKPRTFEEALMQFYVSVAIVVYIQRRGIKYLSMMIHIDGKKKSNELFANWTKETSQQWIDALEQPDNDPMKMSLRESFQEAYNEMKRYVEDCPTADEVWGKMLSVLSDKKIHLVHSISGKSTPEIKWSQSKAHILVGADMLNRGFTIEKLSMTYMPRSAAGRSMADTIQQRCRFFGYKKAYIDVCRIYLSEKSREEYVKYVEHEEALRNALLNCNTIQEFDQMLISENLAPTRNNVLSSRLVRTKLKGWKQMCSLDYIEANTQVFEQLLRDLDGSFEPCTVYSSPERNHRYATVSLKKVRDLINKLKYHDYPNLARRAATIQYLTYLMNRGERNARIYQMAYSFDELRKRSLEEVGGLYYRPNNLQAGVAENGSYPGDVAFKSDSEISIQIHHIKIKDENLSVHNGKVLYNICIFYPERFANSFVTTSVSDDDDE